LGGDISVFGRGYRRPSLGEKDALFGNITQFFAYLCPVFEASLQA